MGGIVRHPWTSHQYISFDISEAEKRSWMNIAWQVASFMQS